ncbi:MAG: DHA2 family efflux MFS transporter permease subunit [Candidatus Zixiibacteriota bacterium]|nr:MAG: DHA2 family efflux MFS transporter permease subunit [candidate division Zixibacteria bacterium]
MESNRHTDTTDEPALQALQRDPAAQWKAFLPIAMVSIASTLNSSVINVSLPVISQALGAGIGVVEWVVMSYLLSLTALLMIAGRVGDLYGRRRTYQWGILAFTVASALCGLSTSIGMLIAFRTLQGAAAALVVAVAPALIGEIYPPAQRGKALGLFGATVSVGLTIGPPLGGFITDWLGWRYIFFISVPLSLLSIVLVRRYLPEDHTHERPSFDWPGSLTLGGGLLFLLLALSRGSDWGWGSPMTLAMVLMAGGLLALFVRVERSLDNPVLDLRLFRHPVFRSAAAAGFLAFSSLFSQTFLIPFYLVQLRDFTTAHAGLFLVAVPVTMAVAAPAAGALSDKIGTRGLCMLGLAVLGISFVLQATFGVDTSAGWIVLALVLTGLGIGTFNAPNNAELLSSVPRHRMGNASGMMGMTRTLGMVVGVALSSAIFTGVRDALLNGGSAAGSAEAPHAFLAGMRWSFLAAAALALLGMVMVWGRGKGAERMEG